MDAVSEIKSRLNIEDVIGQYVQLKRAGRNFKGLSPWTNERTPSFMVSPEKQIWHDFSSGRGGDMFSFVMEMEGLEFRAALEHLARKAGVDLDQFRPQQGQVRSRQKNRAIEASELSAKFYQKQLTVNKAALNYLLKDRKFSRQTLLTWQLGYSPNTGSALTDFLTKHGFTTEETRLAGLSTERNRRQSDMFRGRIMIPLHDSRGAVIGFTARLLADPSTSSGQDAPKYINTPATVAYDKSHHVFGLHLAKESVRKAGYVVVAEGNMDVIASHQAGITNVVASAGTAITERHLRELKRFTADVRLAFDADQAGITATERAIPLAQKAGVNLSIITIDAKDPDELIQKDSKLWQKAIEAARYAPDWLIEHYKKLLDLGTAQGKRAFSDALLVTIRRLSDSVEQEHYLKVVAETIDASLEAVKAKLRAGSASGELAGEDGPLRRKIPKNLEELDKAQADYQKLQDHFLAMALMQPKIRSLLKDIKAEYFSDGPAKVLLGFLQKNPDFKGEHPEDFLKVVAVKPDAEQLQSIGNYVKIIALQFEELYQDLPLEDLKEQATQLKRRLIERYVKIEKTKLIEQMQSETNEKNLEKLITKVDKLNKLLK